MECILRRKVCECEDNIESLQVVVLLAVVYELPGVHSPSKT